MACEREIAEGSGNPEEETWADLCHDYLQEPFSVGVAMSGMHPPHLCSLTFPTQLKAFGIPGNMIVAGG